MIVMKENEFDSVRLSPDLASPSAADLSHSNKFDGVRLSPHFMLREFLQLKRYPKNVPTTQAVVNLTYGCLMLLEPARQIVGPVIVCSGFRCEEVNRRVGGVSRSQHLTGQAADIRPQDPSQYPRLVEFLKACEYTDQLLTGSTWLHVSWTPLGTPRHMIRIGYYK